MVLYNGGPSKLRNTSTKHFGMRQTMVYHMQYEADCGLPDLKHAQNNHNKVSTEFEGSRNILSLHKSKILSLLVSQERPVKGGGNLHSFNLWIESSLKHRYPMASVSMLILMNQAALRRGDLTKQMHV